MRAGAGRAVRDLAGVVRQVLSVTPAVEDFPPDVHELASPDRPGGPVEQGQHRAHRQTPALHVRSRIPQDEDT